MTSSDPGGWPDDPAAGPAPLAGPDSLTGAYELMTRGLTPTQVITQLRRASRAIEGRCDRKFMPFQGLVETPPAEGVSPDASCGAGGLPIAFGDPITLGRAGGGLAADAMVRDFWIDETPRRFPELWTYSDVSVRIEPPLGGASVVAGVEPSRDTGQIRLPYGTYCPLGSLVTITYSGGYTVGYPDDLQEAAMMMFGKMMILRVAPERKGSLNTDDLEQAITELLVPYDRR